MAVKVEEQKAKRTYTFFLPTDDADVRRMLVSRGHKISLFETHEWDIAILTGGIDICPFLYGERMLPQTRCNISRDIKEIQFLKKLHPDRMKVGICRGAQLLNVLAGGRMWQHVDGHALKGTHPVQLWGTPKPIQMSSRHHQMMIPTSRAEVIGVAAESLVKINEIDGQTELTLEQLLALPEGQDPEVLYYEDTHSICFQPHPEDAQESNQECCDFFFDLIDAYWDDKRHDKAMRESD